ncbi:MAG: hypothetical protein KDD98_00450, partial [Sphingomonadaceae bacterium]|nr:hypothetical protein [Sphingomonadaceae bacterium]
GVHRRGVERLMHVLPRLVDGGHSVVVMEHELDLIAEGDWILDLGPDGGVRGGEIVAQGTPEEVAKEPRSYTGQYLKGMLAGQKGAAG